MNLILNISFIFSYTKYNRTQNLGDMNFRGVVTGLTSDDINFKEFPSKNGRTFPTFWQIACPNNIFIGFYAEHRKSQQNFELMISLPYKCVTTVMAIGHG